MDENKIIIRSISGIIKTMYITIENTYNFD